MIEELGKVLGRRLTPDEKKVITWLMGYDRETIDTISGILSAVYKAGQADVEAYNEAMEKGDARD